MRLESALQTVIYRQKVLRTRLLLDESDHVLRQEVQEFSPFEITLTTIVGRQDLEEILLQEQTDGALFDLSKGRVFRCHAIRRKSTKDEDVLEPDDVLIFNFHHAAFDGSSIDIFLRDLRHAYSTNNELKPSALDYIDYSVHEKEMNMDEARAFWKHHLDGFENKILQLPYDRVPLDNNTRSGRGSTISFDLSQDVVDRIVAYMQTNETTLFQLGLAAFHIFLFKLTLETDLCVININANRHRSEVQDIIGFFSNTLPQRVIIDPHATFVQVLHLVKELCFEALAHAYLPYQDMGSLPGIQTLFLAEPVLQEVEVESVLLLPQSSKVGLKVAKFDLTCSLHHNDRTNSITVSFNASCDVFDDATVSNMARRFECLLIQLFISASSIVCTLSLQLPHEVELLRDMDTHTILEPAIHLLPIHYEFACRVNDHPQKIGAVLDDQSLIEV
jgi:hypothetical protein